MWQLNADGIPWIDSDGRNTWDTREAVALVECLESAGFSVEMIEV